MPCAATTSGVRGGLAVSIRGEVRFTRDVDLAVEVVTDAAMEAVVRGLEKRGFDRGQDLGRKLDALLVDVRGQM